jgi:hypothetical protein
VVLGAQAFDAAFVEAADRLRLFPAIGSGIAATGSRYG